MSKEVSSQDREYLVKLRGNVERFMMDVAGSYSFPDSRLLDVAPQNHQGARPFFPDFVEIDTLDIDPQSGATYISDLCCCSNVIGFEKYDFVVCTEVLEHTLQPFDAVNSILDILKPGGLAFVSTPFNFRIHGPLPDCWRFTEHGLRELFKEFEIISLDSLDDEDRFLMPIQYTVVARKSIKL